MSLILHALVPNALELLFPWKSRGDEWMELHSQQYIRFLHICSERCSPLERVWILLCMCVSSVLCLCSGKGPYMVAKSTSVQEVFERADACHLRAIKTS